MNTTKHLGLCLILMALSLSSYSQNYTVLNAPPTSLPTSADGTYAPFSMAGATTIYKHTTLNYYIFRAFTNFWIIADGPDAMADIIVDTKTSTSNTPPLGKWDASAVLDVPLPVNLSSFTGESLPNGIQLDWMTLAETNNKGFWVEHSLDGQHYSNRSWIDGQGTRQEPYAYSYLDQGYFEGGIHYYRLKQVDYDATVEYSQIISIQKDSDNKVKLFPNPVLSTARPLHIQSDQIIQTVYVFDQQGSLLKTIEGQHAQTLDMETGFLRPGLYFLNISTGSSAGFAIPLVVK